MTNSLTSLKDIETSCEITDMDYIFAYHRVFNPDGDPTPYFTLNYKSKSL